MKKTFAAVAASAVMLPLFADEAAPAEVAGSAKWKCPVSAEATIDFLSDYVWRGTLLDKSPVYQPSVTISYDADEFGSLYFNYWTSLDLTHKRNTCWGGGNSRRNGSMIEQDFTLAYCNSLDLGDAGKLSYEIGHYWYDYPYNGPHHKAGSLSSDLYADLAWNTGYVKLGTKLLWGYYTAHEHEPATLYAEFSVSKDFNIEQVEGLKITPKALLGVGNVAFVQNNTGIRDAETAMADQTLSLSASYEVNEHFSIGAKINYTWTPSHTLRHARYMSWGEDNAHMLVWGGVSATPTF